MSAARYVVGIDLGTTHCALAFADANAGEEAAPGGDADRAAGCRGGDRGAGAPPVLLLFRPRERGGPRRALVREAARSPSAPTPATRGVEAPSRVISSAKSWLSHGGVDRRAGILPLGAPEDIEKISPVEASWRYLEHIADAWDARFAASGAGDAPKLGAQEIVLTVPASFDAGARELTVEAAVAAGMDHVTLLEEPQAALYAWIDAQGDGWRAQVKPGDVILVVDVGGGTTDFSAIAVLDRDGSLELARVAVGDHILLGGDNMDLALAHLVRAKVEAEGKELDRWQMVALTYASRIAKERLFADSKLASAPIAIASRGSKLLGGGLRTELTRDEVTRTLVEGYFPLVDASARPAVRARAALTQLGLPYASDAAVTRHLAAFLARQVDATSKLEGFPGRRAGGGAKILQPTALLFNGGVMKATALRERLVRALDAWLEADGAPRLRVLEGGDLDMAVARGAAAYGLVRRGSGLRIRGGTARAYYVGIESPAPAVPGLEPPISALCLAPFGMEEGTVADLPPHEVGVVVGENVRFRFFGSSVRRADGAGIELERWKRDELEELAPIEVTLPAKGRAEGDVVPVRLRASVTEVGTLLLEAIPTKPLDANERWKIELNVRAILEGHEARLGPHQTSGGRCDAQRPRAELTGSWARAFLVGIDLGTTNTVVALARRDGGGEPEILALPQLVSRTETASRAMLPSALYAPLDEEWRGRPLERALRGSVASTRGAAGPKSPGARSLRRRAGSRTLRSTGTRPFFRGGSIRRSRRRGSRPSMRARATLSTSGVPGTRPVRAHRSRSRRSCSPSRRRSTRPRASSPSKRQTRSGSRRACSRSLPRPSTTGCTAPGRRAALGRRVRATRFAILDGGKLERETGTRSSSSATSGGGRRTSRSSASRRRRRRIARRGLARRGRPAPAPRRRQHGPRARARSRGAPHRGAARPRSVRAARRRVPGGERGAPHAERRLGRHRHDRRSGRAPRRWHARHEDHARRGGSARRGGILPQSFARRRADPGADGSRRVRAPLRTRRRDHASRRVVLRPPRCDRCRRRRRAARGPPERWCLPRPAPGGAPRRGDRRVGCVGAPRGPRAGGAGSGRGAGGSRVCARPAWQGDPDRGWLPARLLRRGRARCLVSFGGRPGGARRRAHRSLRRSARGARGSQSGRSFAVLSSSPLERRPASSCGRATRRADTRPETSSRSTKTGSSACPRS